MLIKIVAATKNLTSGFEEGDIISIRGYRDGTTISAESADPNFSVILVEAPGLNEDDLNKLRRQLMEPHDDGINPTGYQKHRKRKILFNSVGETHRAELLGKSYGIKLPWDTVKSWATQSKETQMTETIDVSSKRTPSK